MGMVRHRMLTDPLMKENKKMADMEAMVSSTMPMAMSMKENIKPVSVMGMARCFMRTVMFLMVSGKTVNLASRR